MKAVKILRGIRLFLILLVAIWLGLLLYPQPFFDKKLEIGNPVIYADGASGTAFESEAREALERLAAIEGLERAVEPASSSAAASDAMRFSRGWPGGHPQSQDSGSIRGQGLGLRSGAGGSAGKAVPHSRLEGSVAH